ncbi:MAG: RsfA family transcriptional regulator [Alicyclobacillus sp.]|nr:RsfA family transcriptional regulator [Alicyclobacillus sp.]
MVLAKLPPRRTDVWTAEEDQQLKDTVLEFIRTGRSQLAAFQTVGEALGRTAAACGFRWNGVLRRNLDNEVFEAKQERLLLLSRLNEPSNASVPDRTDTSTSVDTQTPSAPTESHTTPVRSAASQGMEEVIKFLTNLEHAYEDLRRQRDDLEESCAELQHRVHALQMRMMGGPDPQPLQLTPEQIERDAQVLAGIMNRARRLVDHA